MRFSMLVMGVCVMLGPQQAPSPVGAEAPWLKGFEGRWVVDGAVGADADIIVSIAREGNLVVLRANLANNTMVTSYDVSGAEIVNRGATFRTRLDGQKMVTEIRFSTFPLMIETRYLESADRMVTEVVYPPSKEPFNRGVLRRK